jgi:head-tail adaptor
MARCERIQRRRARACIGEMSERIFVENRVLDPPDFGTMDSGFTFTAHESATEVWAVVETTQGTTLFDDVAGLDRVVTHHIVIRKITGVSAETWLRLVDGRRLDILSVANLDERDEFLEIMAAESGLNTQAGSGL